MTGRYGGDELYVALVWLLLGLMIINTFIRSFILSAFGTALTVISIIRFLSRNIPARMRENNAYLRLRNPIKNWLNWQKENLIPILVGCTCGSIASMGCVFALCKLFHLEDAMTYALLPKSVTTAIAMGISASHGGYVSITVVAVICTGILGNILAPVLIRLFRVDDPMTAGLAIGSCSHAIGTTRALSLGETEGAMSGLAIGICGIITVILSLFI